MKKIESTPHARDPPTTSLLPSSHLVSTPHARGSTWCGTRAGRRKGVYPACAGIHLERTELLKVDPCLPRMRGDPPLCSSSLLLPNMSTPHARGSTP